MLTRGLDHVEPLVREHVAWAIARTRSDPTAAALRKRLER